MKIGRIIYNQKELYPIIINNELFNSNVGRNNLGVESFFTEDIIKGEKISDINDAGVTWLAPICRPGKIICVGRNYLKHSEEQNLNPEIKPLLFSKYSSCQIGHLSEIEYPSHTDNLDYEVELAVIIGKTATKIGEEEDPFDYIYGYTIANDLTARDVQKSEKQWTRGKAFDQSLPIGPHIITKDEVDPNNLEIWLTVNGEKRQLSNTKNMIFDIPFLIRYISQQITLEAGDILLTGTPEGVGMYMIPKAVLQKGDHIACGIIELGELRFSIKAS